MEITFKHNYRCAGSDNSRTTCGPTRQIAITHSRSHNDGMGNIFNRTLFPAFPLDAADPLSGARHYEWSSFASSTAARPAQRSERADALLSAQWLCPVPQKGIFRVVLIATPSSAHKCWLRRAGALDDERDSSCRNNHPDWDISGSGHVLSSVGVAQPVC